MSKIVIIGSSGAGKSTFARVLSSIFKIKVFHLDRLLWQRGWEERNGYARMEILDKILLDDKQCIIEGNYLRFVKFHVAEANTIIFLDIPFYLCLWRVVKRHYTRQERRRDIPEGCVDRLTFSHLWKVLIFPLTGRKLIEQTLQNYQSKYIIRLSSTQEVKDFLIQLEQDANNIRNSSSTDSAVEKSRLVIAR